MKPITDYQDYRCYVQDYYDERKRVSSFSWREFARAAGFTSPIYLKLVCEGKTRLSSVGAEKVGAAMRLVGYELDYFKLMVECCHAKTDDERKAIFESMLKIAKDNAVKVVDGDAYRYFETWIHPVVRELAPVMPGATPGEIARRCCLDASAGQVRESLDFMVDAGLLKKNGDAYEQVDRHLTGSPEIMSVAMRSMHHEMIHFADEALEKFSSTERGMPTLLNFPERRTTRVAKRTVWFNPWGPGSASAESGRGLKRRLIVRTRSSAMLLLPANCTAAGPTGSMKWDPRSATTKLPPTLRARPETAPTCSI